MSSSSRAWSGVSLLDFMMFALVQGTSFLSLLYSPADDIPPRYKRITVSGENF